MAVHFARHRELGKLSGKVIRKGNGWCRASWEKAAGGESSWELVQFWSRGSGRFLWRSCPGMRQERPNPLERVLLHNPMLGPCPLSNLFSRWAVPSREDPCTGHCSSTNARQTNSCLYTSPRVKSIGVVSVCHPGVIVMPWGKSSCFVSFSSHLAFGKLHMHI